jgi:hypothetical protein
MARMQIVADARWLTRAITNILTFIALLIGGVWLFAGRWWATATAVLLVWVALLLWRVIRR